MNDKIKVPLNTSLIASIFLQDIKKSKTQSAIFGLSVAAGVIGLFILLVSTMTFSVQL
jgi:hypothetical protein